MNIRILREEIKQISDAMNEQMEIIQQHKGKIPQIEIDLFMANVRDLYEACISLNKLNQNIESQSSKRTADVEIEDVGDEDIPFPVNEISIRETIKFMTQVEETSDDVEEIPMRLSLEKEFHPEPEEIKGPEVFAAPEVIGIPEIMVAPEIIVAPEPLIAAVPEPQPTSVPVVEVVVEADAEPEYEPIVLISPKPDPAPTPNPARSSSDLFSAGGATTIADKLKEEKITLNDRLQSENQKKAPITSQLHQNQIRDLKSAIGINEKFQFINDLFRGNMQDYTLAITQLNQFSSFEEALEYIDILKFKYTWDVNSDAHHKLMDFVRRRYL
ncbi:MAG: hypothetical protein WCO63_10550 [Bacteroidota bacterium]